MKTASRVRACGVRSRLFTVALLGLFLSLLSQSYGGVIFETLFGKLAGSRPQARLTLGSDGNFYGTTSQGGANDIGTVFRMTSSGVVTTLVSFKFTDGGLPSGRLVLGTDGYFYGTTQAGGANNKGTVFKMTPAGYLSTLLSFDGTNGQKPTAGLVQGSDGNFYGTTPEGGENGKGTVFKISPIGVLTTLVSFDGTNGQTPTGGLVRGLDRSFYGMTSAGGANGKGTVFKMTPAGVLTSLVSFDGTNGAAPFLTGDTLIQASDGNFYGTTSEGGANDKGTVFKMTPAGVLTPLASFDGTNGNAPVGGVVEVSGNFYGTASQGGANDKGTVFKMTPAGVLTALASFDGITNGAGPVGGLLRGSDGNLYGAGIGGINPEDLGSVFKVTLAGELTRLVNFTNSGRAGLTGLLAGSDGNVYATTRAGGASDKGTIIKVTPAGIGTTLAEFTGTNGAVPSGGLLEGSDGNFYGTTEGGGANDKGLVFKMTPAGVLTPLASFIGTNGQKPSGGLVEANGNFYGTTEEGGANDKGTIFRMTPDGVLTTLVDFNGTNGQKPSGGLVLGADGNFYGTTQEGGAAYRPDPDGSAGAGIIFKMTPAGALSTVADFFDTLDVNNIQNLTYRPLGVIQGSDGNFYGTTQEGGARSMGAIFKSTPAGALTILANFDVSIGIPYFSTIVEGSDGKFYGTTLKEGDGGILFRVTSAGTMSILADFTQTLGEVYAAGNLCFGSDGKLYGGVGLFDEELTIYRVTLPPGDPTLTEPAPGTVTRGPLPVSFTLPEEALDGSVKLLFVPFNPFLTVELTMAASLETKGAHSFMFDTTDVLANPEIISATINGQPLSLLGKGIPDISVPTMGIYTVILSYSSKTGIPQSRPYSAGVIIDRTPPFIEQLADLDVFSSDPTGAIVTYATPVVGDSSGLVTASYSKASGTLFSHGITKVRVTAEDKAHNRATMTFNVNVYGPFPAHSTVLAQGDPAPGIDWAGGPPNGPPGDAVAASFGVPAIDDDGNIAFTATWTSATGGAGGRPTKGTGLFFNDDTCLAVTGGEVPDYTGSTFKSFGDPVICGGRIACLATITGTVNGGVVLVGPMFGPLAVATRIGSEAPGVSAPFKSFKGIEVSSSHLALLATAGNTTGLWVKDIFGPMELALRVGQTIDGKTINKLVSFAPGSGSPGSGRGWLRQLPVLGTSRVLALCQFTDKSQAVVAVDTDDLANPVMLSQSGPGGIGGPAAGGSFASYSFPAANSEMQSAFLASLTPGGAVTKTNQRGIFVQLDGSDTYTLLAQTTAPAGATGANFSLLKDPVLASDGGLAFPATIKGGNVKGAAAQTLWWKKPGDIAPTLLAQGGADATEWPGAKWKAFTSLAIAQDGPIFAATLTPGSGQSGVWATDAAGGKRLLFRTGGMVAGKTLKSFTLLNTTVGSPGVTRSFNDNAQLVWRATFTDKTTAIIMTEVP